MQCLYTGATKCWTQTAARQQSSTVCALTFAGFNVCGYRGSAAIREYFVRKYFNTTIPSNREFKKRKKMQKLQIHEI